MANSSLTKGDLKRELAAMEKRLGGKFQAIDGKFAALDGKFVAIDGKFVAMEKRLDGKLQAMDEKFVATGKGIVTELKDYVHEGVETVVSAIDGMNSANKKEIADLRSRMDEHFPLN